MFLDKFRKIYFIDLGGILGEATSVAYSHSAGDEVDECLYYVNSLSNVLQFAPEFMWVTFAETNMAKCANGAAILETGQFFVLFLDVPQLT